MKSTQDGSTSVSHPHHAGVDSDGLTVVAFDTEDQLLDMLSKIGVTVAADRTLKDRDGRVLSCSSCDAPVTVEKVGHVMPGSTHVYCKDPVCILDYLERFG